MGQAVSQGSILLIKFQVAIFRLRPAVLVVILIGMKTLSLLLMTVALQAAEPRFQFRSFIQNDGTLMNVKLDTTTGQTWRLDRTLINRRETTLAGKATERKLDEAIHKRIDNLSSFTVAEVIQVMNAINLKLMGENLVPIVFRDPAANPAVNAKEARLQLVPPRQEFGEEPANIDPNTGLPLRPGRPRFQVDPVTRLSLVDPATGFPLLIGGNPRPNPNPNFPDGGIPKINPRHTNARQPARSSPDNVRIRHWAKGLKNQSSLNVITEVLNALDSPLRCVIDENIVYLLPESATLTTRDGKTNKPKYEDRWVEIKTAKEK